MEMVQETKRGSRRTCPRETANIVSTVTFFYTFKLFLKSFKKDLEEEDIYKVYGKFDSEKLVQRLEKLCSRRSGKTGLVSIVKILLQCFYRDLLLIVFVDTIYKLVLSNVTASAVGKLVDHFTPGSNMTIGETYYYAGTIVTFKLFDAFFLPIFLVYFYEYALKTKTAFSALIYKKILKLKQEDLNDHNAGRIVTLITKDVSYIHEFMLCCSNFFTETVQNIVIVYNLHCTIGLTAYVGVGVLLSIMPFQLYLERHIRRIRLDLSKKTDRRLQATKETLSFIKVMKMYTWELTFADKISEIRREEVMKLRSVLYLQGVIFASGFLITQIALYVVLTISTSYKETSAEDIFYVVANFTFLELSFVKAYPTLAIFSAEMLAGMKRIFNLLNSEETSKQISDQNGDRTLIDVHNATVRIAGQIVLNRISCTLKPGLNVITGPLGSGKTALLKTILKEFPLTEGTLTVEGTVSYAGQELWLFPGTIKKNIVFSDETDKERYRQVLSVCALNYDLNLLTDGDQTIVEDNGSNLSKGQQARINLARAVYSYTFKLFLKSFKRDLEEEDIYEICGKFDSEKLVQRLEKLCPRRSGKTGLVLIIKILLQCFYRDLLLIIFVDLIYKLVLSNVTASAVGKLVDHFTPGSNMTISETYYYAGTIVTFKLFDAFFLPIFLVYYYEYALKTKTAFSGLIYKKILKLKHEDLNDHNAGRIVTLITKDVSYIHEFMLCCSNFFTETVQNIVIVYNLHCTIGLTAYVGVGVLLSIVPFQLYLERHIRRIRLDLSKKSDRRLQTTKETLSFIKVIKMYMWELTFADKISEIRREEVVKLRSILYLQGVIFASGFLITQIALYVVLTISTSYKGTSAEDIFYVIVNFTFLELSFVKAYPALAIFSAEMLAGMKRIFNLLNSEETSKQISHQKGARTLVDVHNATVRIAGQIVLNRISCTLKPGLNVITGPLGSGKTALLKTILKEFPLTEGTLTVEGTVSYAGQEPWIFPGTLKKNIVFGEETDEERYRQVLSVCALNYDLNLLTDGDQTIVEDNGSNLSKGEQARINLARAIYRESKIYLLDDCLASLDVRVQEHIFQRCFKEFLRGKICIYVTQNPKHIKKAQRLINMNRGVIVSNEAPLKTYSGQLPESIETGNDSTSLKDQPVDIVTASDVNSLNEESELISKETETCDFNLYREIKKIGTLNFSVYKRYIKFGGSIILLFLTVFIILGDQVVGGYREKTLSNWVNVMTVSINLSQNSTEYVETKILQNRSFFTYSMSICATVLTVILKTLCFSYYMSKISINIHTSMIKNIATATMDFFDKNHLGNILNRFSTDLSIVDEKLDAVLMEFMKVFGDICVTFILIATINPIHLIPSTVITVLLLILRGLYMPTGRSLKRLENATRSPLIGHIVTTLSGMTTIRAFGKENQMISEFNEYLNLNTSTLHMSLMTQFALSVYVNVLSFLYICYVLTDLLFFNIAQAGDAGLILNKCFKLSENLQSGIVCGALLENLLTAVERILEYTDVKREHQTGRIIDNWPGEGSLEYVRLSLGYPATEELALKSVNFKIAPQEKIGIIGRTGSGKSSLVSVLFRLYDVQGDIIIDNEHIKTVSLNCLRSRISIIPQDSVLFSGTLRDNIDPKSEFSDTKIWHVLEKVQLTRVVPYLGAEMKDGGVEMTIGQKQLLSVARALLRKNRIVVLDEPTANLDLETDRLINEIVKTEFSDCTILNVAHKLDSIAGCDKILVMEKGEVTDFDTTQAILENLQRNF